jgi:hypothetical protein
VPKERKKERYFWDSESIASLSLLSHDGTRRDPFQGHARPSIGPREPGVYEDGRACDLPRACVPHVPRDGGGICGVLCGISRTGVRCAIALILPLIAATVSPRVAQSNPLRDLAYRDLCDSVRGLYGIDPHFNLWNYFFHVWHP